MSNLNAIKDLKLPLHKYQIQVKNFVKKTPFCGLFLEMGLGKTLSTLAALYEINPACNVLVIAPKPIARATWVKEINQWKIPIQYHSFIVDENDKELTRKKRLIAYQKAVEQTKNKQFAIYFINRELLIDLIKNIPWIFPVVVIDESQSFKNHKSLRFKALKSVRPKIKRLIELTGTPMPNGIMDLWAQIYLLDQGKRLFPYISHYQKAYFRSMGNINGVPIKHKPIEGAKERIQNLIKDITISVENNQLQLPPLTMNKIIVHMEPDAYELYQKMRKDMCLEFSTNNETTQITATNSAVLYGKLSQMASGAIYTGNNKEFITIHTAKLEYCDRIINNTNGPIIIAYNFQSDKDMLCNYLTKVGHNVAVFDGTPSMIDRWNKQEIPVMLLQPASAGHGLNLQYGGHTLIWYTIPWSLELYQQCNARLYRQGQTKPVIIHHLLTAKTIDEQIIKAIQNKAIDQKELIEAVSMHMK